MAPRVIYKNPDDTVSVFIPAPEILAQYAIEVIAPLAVPEGLAYKIVDEADIPSDRTSRDAWIIDDALLTDGVGSQHNTLEALA